MENPDILISGGGIAGLIATAAFADLGYHVTCCDAGPRNPAQTDTRSTAFLLPSVELLKDIGLWQNLEPHAAELRVMRLADAGGAEPDLRYVADFDASELGHGQFGWNVPNALIRKGILQKLNKLDNVTICFESKVTRVLSRDANAIATLSTGTTLKPKLVIAADGRNSELREAAGIPVKRTRFGQKALVFTVSHPEPHNGVSTEIHRSGGPFTLVPLPDPHRSAVVWMENGPEATRLAKIDKEAFTEALNARGCKVLGTLTLESDRALWPIISQQAERLCEGRMALIAEAAHVMPPIGAQGLNMSLADIASLRDLCGNKANDPGAADLLLRYEQTRLSDMRNRVEGVAVLNRAAQSSSQAIRDLRLAGLKALFETKALRQTAMRKGLGLSGQA